MKLLKLGLVMCFLISLCGCSSMSSASVSSKKIEEMTELPIIHVDTYNNTEINKLDKVDLKAEFKITNSNGYDMKLTADGEDYPMTIKGRGNSSWTMPTGKKPYNIKFEEKVDLFGFGEAKKWSLIASWTDTSFVRNYIGYKLGRQLDETVPDCEMVELVINGNYEGIYLLCEAYGIKEHRVETRDDGADMDGDGEVTEFLIEADSRAITNKEPNAFQINNEYWMVIKEPDEEDILDPTDLRYIYLSEHFQKINDAIVNLDNYEDYIDVDSLVDMYIINEFLKNPDWGFGNQPCYASTFMYMEEGGKLYFGPLWDCDISMGRNDYGDSEFEGFRDTYSPEGMLTANTHWINSLLQDEAFVSKVKARWQEFKPIIQQMIDVDAPAMIEKVRLSYELDFKTWDEEYSDRTTEWSLRVPLSFEEESAWVIEFMTRRLAYLDTVWGE